MESQQAGLPQTGKYAFSPYVSKARWIGMWHQVDEILSVQPQSVLEVGAGPGITGDILARNGVKHTTLDIDPALEPDYIGTAGELPFSDASFDVVASFQVLEHLPYESFLPTLREFARVTRRYVILSLPDARRSWSYSVHVPKLGAVRLRVPRPQLRPRRLQPNDEHYWEIETLGYPLQRILADIAASGLTVQRTYRVFESPYFRFFVLTSS